MRNNKTDTFIRKTEITDKVEVKELNNCLTVSSDIKYALIKQSFFVNKKDFPN